MSRHHPPDERRKLLSPRDAGELRWYFRESDGDVSGVGGSGFEPVIGPTEPSSDDAIVRAFERSRTVKRLRQIERARNLLVMTGVGIWHWTVLRIVYGWPRRDDPWQDFARDPELAPLVRHAPSLRAAGLKAALDEDRGILGRMHALERERLQKEGGSSVAAAERIFVLIDHPSLAPSADDVGRAAVRAWEIAFRGKKESRDPELCTRARHEARVMYVGAADAWRAVRAAASAGSRRRVDVDDLPPLGDSTARLLAAKGRAG